MHQCFEIIKITLKSVVLVFFWDLSAENLSRTDVAKYLTFLSSNWKFCRKHFLMKNYVVDMRWWVPSQIIYWVLAPVLLLLKILAGESFFACLVPLVACFIIVYISKCHFVNHFFFFLFFLFFIEFEHGGIRRVSETTLAAKIITN